MMSLYTGQDLDCRSLATLTARTVSQEVYWKDVIFARDYVTRRN